MTNDAHASLAVRGSASDFVSTMSEPANLPHIGESTPRSRHYKIARNVQTADSGLMSKTRRQLPKLPKRCTYPYRDAAGVKCFHHYHGPTTAPEVQPEATTSVKDGEDKQGHHYRFYFKK
jgi:hypothetical protein